MNSLADYIAVVLFGMLLGFGIGTWWSSDKQLKADKDAAVESGRAEYYLDINNTKQWRWK